MTRSPGKSLTKFESDLWADGVDLVAGVDEAGRGPLAGPVVAAAVVLPKKARLEGLADSKMLPPPKRQELALAIRDQAVAVGVGVVDHARIDKVNILRATMEAMRAAVDALGRTPDVALIDGTHAPDLTCPCRCIVGGDALCRAIAAASIIAKTHRDAIMLGLDAEFPAYGFAQHKGYGTPEHLAAIATHGPCPVHRRTFSPFRAAQLELFEA